MTNLLIVVILLSLPGVGAAVPRLALDVESTRKELVSQGYSDSYVDSVPNKYKVKVIVDP
jgi:hypothetical protein